MSEEHSMLREKLVRLEVTSPALREKYEKEISAVLTQKLEGVWKWSLVATGLLSLVMGGTFLTAAVVGGGLPPLIRIGFAIGAAFAFAWTAKVVWILWGKQYNCRSHPTWMAHWAWGVTLTIMIIFLMQGGKNPDSVRSVFMVVGGLCYFLMAAVFMLANRIEQAELRTREKLLEIELRLAELAEKKTPTP